MADDMTPGSNAASGIPDVLIVGGGAIGLLSARELAAEGLSVTVLERGETGQEASWAGGGILCPVDPWRTPEPVLDLCRWSQARYPELAAALLQETGVDPEWVQSGFLISCGEEYAAATAWCRREGIEWQEVSPADLAAIEPRVRLQTNGGLLIPGIAQIRNPRFMRSLRLAAERQGVQILEGREMREIEVVDGRVDAVVSAQGRHRAASYLLAAGAWSRLLTPNLIPPISVEPVKGQMLAYQGQPDWLSHIVLSEGRYLIPRRDGVILAGSTVEYADFDKTATSAARSELERFASSVLPDLQPAAVLRHWAGLRPGSPTGIPYICRHPQLSNFFLNCGHFRNGLVTAPASARLVTDLILQRPPTLPAEPYTLEAPH